MSKMRLRKDLVVVDRFLHSPSEESFEPLFHSFTPQLIAFFRSRGCDFSVAEDLAQEVMFTVYRKVAQLRDPASFRGWVFKIALNGMRGHFGPRKARELETVDLADIADRLVTQGNDGPFGSPAFEFQRWMAFLDSSQSDVMQLRFIEQWEYHEIAAAKAIPIGTVKSWIFSAKKRLAPHLTKRNGDLRKAA